MAVKFLLIGEPMGLFIAQSYGKLSEATQFTASVAGAELNVAIGLTRLGHEVCYCTKLGIDPHGERIRRSLQKNKISDAFALTDEQRLTGFMMKSQVENGDPEIYYYRKNSAASTISPQDVEKLDLSTCQALHLTGIFPAISDTACSAAFALIDRAREAKLRITFDPNLRLQLWASEQQMISTLQGIAASAHVVLPGLVEGERLTGESTPEGIAAQYHRMGVEQVVVKLGAKGAYFSHKEIDSGYVEAFPINRVVDTVGAGDGFAAGVISALAEGMTLREAAYRGNVIGAKQVTEKSDNEGLPTREALEDLIRKGGIYD